MYDEISPDLLQAYIDTNYIVYTPFKEYTLKIGVMNQDWQKLLQSKLCQFYFFITAWNPYSILQLDSINEESNLKLLYKIQELHLEFFEGMGISSDKKWFEKSFCVLGGDIDLVISLGREFRQNAVVYGSSHHCPTLLRTKDRV